MQLCFHLTRFDGSGGRGDCGAIAGQHAFEHLGGGQLLHDTGHGQLMGIFFGTQDDVDVVLAAATGEHRVEQLSGLPARHDAVHRVGGQSLGRVNG